MNMGIYYFSGSGNSLHVARELQKGLPQTTLIPLVSLLNQPSVVTTGDAVGFVFPQHGWQMPVMVDEILQKFELHSASYIFAVATRGGTPCRAFLEMEKTLNRKGRNLDAYFVLTMPGSTQSLIKTFHEKINEERIARLETEMLTRLKEIVRIIRSREAYHDENLDGVDMPPVNHFMEPLVLSLARLAESNFIFYSDAKCKGCGICEKVCLAEKIKLVEDHPIWQKNVKCLNCFSCLNYCPEMAVQLKSSWYFKSYTPQNGRYHHSQITADDIAGQKISPDPVSG
ncbi:MAG: ferredoxin [Leptolinea sp.]|jgi:ferredoxin|nr:ferredoxin [Leptolinea sp.]